MYKEFLLEQPYLFFQNAYLGLVLLLLGCRAARVGAFGRLRFRAKQFLVVCKLFPQREQLLTHPLDLSILSCNILLQGAVLGAVVNGFFLLYELLTLFFDLLLFLFDKVLHVVNVVNRLLNLRYVEGVVAAFAIRPLLQLNHQALKVECLFLFRHYLIYLA